MNVITDLNWPLSHPRQLPSSILPSRSGGELKNPELKPERKEYKPECGQPNGADGNGPLDVDGVPKSALRIAIEGRLHFLGII